MNYDSCSKMTLSRKWQSIPIYHNGELVHEKEHSDWNGTQRKTKRTRPTFPSTHGRDIVTASPSMNYPAIKSLPSCFELHYETEATCSFIMNISFHLYANKTK